MHRSLIKPKDDPPTKPLMDTQELTDLAKTVVLKEVEQQIAHIVHEQTSIEQLQTQLDNIQSMLVEIRDSKNEYNTLKLEVLQKLKNRLNEE